MIFLVTLVELESRSFLNMNFKIATAVDRTNDLTDQNTDFTPHVRTHLKGLLYPDPGAWTGSGSDLTENLI